jgi:hypothetical protein
VTAEDVGEKPPDMHDDPHMGIWVLHPITLNMLAIPSLNDFPNTWKQGRGAAQKTDDPMLSHAAGDDFASRCFHCWHATGLPVCGSQAASSC